MNENEHRMTGEELAEVQERAAKIRERAEALEPEVHALAMEFRALSKELHAAGQDAGDDERQGLWEASGWNAVTHATDLLAGHLISVSGTFPTQRRYVELCDEYGTTPVKVQGVPAWAESVLAGRDAPPFLAPEVAEKFHRTGRIYPVVTTTSPSGRELKYIVGDVPDWIDLDAVIPVEVRERLFELRQDAEELEPTIRQLAARHAELDRAMSAATNDAPGDWFGELRGWAGWDAADERVDLLVGHLLGDSIPSREGYQSLWDRHCTEPVERAPLFTEE